MDQADILEKAAELQRIIKETDSKSEEESAEEALWEMRAALKAFDGRLIDVGGHPVRIWHSHYATFHAFGNKRTHYRWSDNKASLVASPGWVFLDEPDVDVDALDDAEQDIRAANTRINTIRSGCIHKVNPNDFEETEEEDPSVFFGSGVVGEAFCMICGGRVTS